MTLWTIIDTIAVGWNPVSIESVYPLDVTTVRLSKLSQAGAFDAEMPMLDVSVEGDAVEAKYSPPTGRGRDTGALTLFRPVFRGRLASSDVVRLTGSFGCDGPTRLLFFASIAVIVAMMAGYPLFSALWIVPVGFVAASVIGRVNAIDDVRLILNNLTYALRGDG